MKKLKTIRQLDQRPHARNELRAADQLITQKTQTPTTGGTGGGGGTGGPGQDVGISGTPCAGVAQFGKTANWVSGPNLSMRFFWDYDGYNAEFEGDPPYVFFTTPQTLRIKCRWTNISADAEDRSFIEFWLSGDDPVVSGNYIIIKPAQSASIPWGVYWNGGSSPAADGSEFDELDRSGIDISEWTWLLFESSSEYIKVKIWQDGDAEPASWGAVAVRPPGDTQDITGSRFTNLTNNWSVGGGNAGYWIWEFGYFDLTGGDVDYGSPTDLFNRTVPEGWGTSTSGWPWSLTIGDPTTADAAIDVNGSSGSGSTTQLVWQDEFNRVVASGWGTPDSGGFWDLVVGPGDVNGSTAGTGVLYILWTDGTMLNGYDFGPPPIEYYLRFVPSTTLWFINTQTQGGLIPEVSVEWLDATTVFLSLVFPTTAGNATYFADVTVSDAENPIDIRFQVYGESLRCKVWNTSDSEPSTWHTLDESSSGWPSGGTPDFTYPGFSGLTGDFEDGRLDFVRVYSVDTCGQELTALSGLYATQGVFGAPETNAAVVPGILATCTRISTTQYDLPTNALYVKNVYIDGIQLSGAMWNFNFNSGKRITFLSTISSTAVVTARYVPA